jgi:hypothetical protein
VQAFRYLAVSMVLFLSACMSVPDAEQSAPTISFSTSQSVTVAVIDNRPYVLNGDKERYFSGLSRDSFGVPWSLPTYNKQPMSDLLQDRVLAGLKNQNVAVTPLKNASSATVSNISTWVAASGSDKSLVIVLNEWKTNWLPDGYVFNASHHIDFIYNVDIQVFDNKGKLMTSEKFYGEETEDQDGMNIYAQFHKIYKHKLEEFINSPKISSALK